VSVPVPPTFPCSLTKLLLVLWCWRGGFTPTLTGSSVRTGHPIPSIGANTWDSSKRNTGHRYTSRIERKSSANPNLFFYFGRRLQNNRTHPPHSHHTHYPSLLPFSLALFNFSPSSSPTSLINILPSGAGRKRYVLTDMPSSQANSFVCFFPPVLKLQFLSAFD
jgi:hypothetical protein